MTECATKTIRCLVFLFSLVLVSFAKGDELAASAPAPTALVGSKAVDNMPAGAHAAPGLSEAERIARLDRSVESDEKRIGELKASLNDPDSDYVAAEAEFEQLDAQLLDKKKQLDDLKKVPDPDKSRLAQTELAALEKKWELARQRFELAIRERKALQESIAALEQKLTSDRQALEELRDPKGPDAAGAPTNDSKPGHAEDSPPADTKSAAATHALPASPSGTSEHGKPAHDHAHQISADVTGGLQEPRSDKPQEQVAAAAAQETEAAADAAEHEAQSVAERIKILQKNIALARELRTTARDKIDNADAILKGLNEELFRNPANADTLKLQIQEATARVLEARTESRDVTTHLDDLQSTLVSLQSEQLEASAEAEQKRQAAEQAAAVVKDLHNPFTSHNLLQWLIDHAPKLLAILIAMSTLLRVSRVLEGRFVSLIANRGRIGNREERESRAQTLLGIFHNAANILILGGGVVALLDEVGIPVAPLIGGAAVVGLAVAFGAQSLIKDYFTGFLVLLEQQYLVNDVIKIGDITGQVERITLRITMLRDLEGRVHFIPHGQIGSVTNTTHGWARAVFDIRVTYRENIDRVIEVLMQLAGEMRASDTYGKMILSDPVMLGVDALTESGVLVKFHIKTRPLLASDVKRELLRRIKNKFDELGIEFSCPRLALHRPDDGALAVIARERRAG